MNNKKEKIRIFLPFSWVICAVISFAFINAHRLNPQILKIFSIIKIMNNNKEKIRMFLRFSWVICAAISFAYINSHLINT